VNGHEVLFWFSKTVTFCNCTSQVSTVLVFHDNWVPVTTAWRVLRLRIEERPPIRRVVANILSKQ
jgi:hypothetical protein